MRIEQALETIELTLEWLDNLEMAIGGTTQLVDAMPNGFAGRIALRELQSHFGYEAEEEAEEEDPQDVPVQDVDWL